MLLFVQGHLTTKSDVYSFGVVLLEILSGKKAIDKNRPKGEHNLVDWAKPYLNSKRKVFRVFDPRLEGQHSPKRALQAAEIALQCLSMDPKLRPSMDEVVTALEQLQTRKDKAKNDQKGEQGHSNGEPKSGGITEPEAARVTAYPRPSASPLYS